MKLPMNVNLQDKVVVITGAAGVICAHLASAIAQSGAKVAILDRDLAKAQEVAAEVRSQGYLAEGFEANVLVKDSLETCHQQVLEKFGPCDILINGAGGNNPKATTANGYAALGDELKGIKTFFDLDEAGISFVFNLNFLGTLLPSQIFAKDMIVI